MDLFGIRLFIEQKYYQFLNWASTPLPQVYTKFDRLFDSVQFVVILGLIAVLVLR